MLEEESASAIFALYTLGKAYDEMFDGAHSYRPHYAAIQERLRSLPIVTVRPRASNASFRLTWCRGW